MSTIKTPTPCPECGKARRLNTLGFLCGCLMRKHTWLSYQFPVYAAAPDLLAACKLALGWMETPMEDYPKNRAKAIAQIRDAIAKAENGV